MYIVVSFLSVYKLTKACHRLETKLQLTDIISYHIIHHITSYHITSHHISYHIISYIISYHIISYIISHHIISYHIISYHIISYIISYIISHHIIYHITSYHISYHIISYIISYIISHHIQRRCEIVGFLRDSTEFFRLLGYYAVFSDLKQTFRDYLPVPSLRVKLFKNQLKPRNNPEYEITRYNHDISEHPVILNVIVTAPGTPYHCVSEAYV
jgi:hypothetical protein